MFAKKHNARRRGPPTFEDLLAPHLGHRPLQFQGMSPIHLPIAKNPDSKLKSRRKITYSLIDRRFGDNPVLHGGRPKCTPQPCPMPLLSISVSRVTLGLEFNVVFLSESFSFLRYPPPPADTFQPHIKPWTTKGWRVPYRPTSWTTMALLRV